MSRSSGQPPRHRPPSVQRGRLAHVAPGLVVFLLALLVRVIYTLQSQANPQFATPLMDPAYHDEWAWQLATGTWKPDGPFFRAPFYPLFLAGIYRLVGHNFLVPRLIQDSLGAASCLLTFLIGTRLFSRKVGLLAGLGAALYGILVFFDNELLTEGLLLTLTLAFFYTFLLTLDGAPQAATRRAPAATVTRGRSALPLLPALSGVLYGLAAITRPTVLIFAPAIAWAFLRGVRRNAVLAFVTLALVPIAIVTAYNATVGDDFVIIASQGGVNFYIGNNERSDGHTAIVPGTRSDWWGGRFDTIKIAEREVGHPLKESQVSSFWFRKGLAAIAAHPLQWIGLTARKFALFWSAEEIGNNEQIHYQSAYAPIMRFPLLGFGVVAPLACAGALLALRQRRRAAFLPLLWIALYMVGVVAFFVCARYRLPVIPFLLIFAAFGVCEGVALWKRGERRSLLMPVLLLIGVALAVNARPFTKGENLAQARYHDGIAWKKKGNLAQAERAYRDAVRLDPGLEEAASNLANLLVQRGDAVAARRLYEQAIASDPHNVMSYVNLASLQLESGEPAAAESTVTRALAIDPDFSEALRILGVIRERQGDLAGAREAYLHAMRFTREQPRLENNLAGLAMREGRHAEAEERLRRAVALDPSYALAWSNLGALMVNTGRLADAVPALERAAALQPDSPAAWSQLAEVLRRLGRSAEADRAAQRAKAARIGKEKS